MWGGGEKKFWRTSDRALLGSEGSKTRTANYYMSTTKTQRQADLKIGKQPTCFCMGTAQRKPVLPPSTAIDAPQQLLPLAVPVTPLAQETDKKCKSPDESSDKTDTEAERQPKKRSRLITCLD